ncbi:MAG: hypothetical protein CSB47_05015 [Proteobacteria bacterium]|nr:MAG: hypothetical protein CSB47_05015 [Pseudomonadota bacterium]
MFKKLFPLLLATSVMTISMTCAADQAMIILDGSGSMQGQVDGKAKMTIAKETLNKVVNDWDENIDFGLMAYGHNRKGDCSDIEVLIPLSKIDKNAVLEKVKAIKPKGKTPISDSLQQAAKKLHFTEDKATIILISDGKETCNADPCTTAKELEEKGIDFTAHVIGFNVDTNTDKQLACIANATGGEYFSAKNANDLNSAMKKAVKKVEKKEPVKERTVRVVRAKTGLKYNLVLTASETEGGEQVDGHFTIYQADKENEEDLKLVKKCSSLSNPTVGYPCREKLPAGDYIIRTEMHKTFIKDTNVTLKEDEKSVINIVTGETSEMNITAAAGDSDEPIRASFGVARIVNGEKVTIDGCYNFNKNCELKLPPSDYIIEVTVPFGKHQFKSGSTKITLQPNEKLSILVPVD